MRTQAVYHGEAGIESLARAYGPALKRFFERRILEYADVEDLVQEVFVRLARHADLNQVENVEGYLFQIAANILRDRFRHRYSHYTNKHEPISISYADDAAFSPERLLIGREAVDRLGEALLALPERTRTIFVLCRIHDVPYADVARRIGISLSAVNKHMARALDHLMDHMKDVL